MTVSTTTGFPVAVSATTAKAASLRPGQNRRRRISPEAGHALEKLGHAIEYLTDEFVHEGGQFSASDERIQAVQLVMAANRQVYFSCPEIPTLSDRFLSLLGL